MIWYDSTMIIILPALLLSMYAQFKVSSAMSRNNQIRNTRGLTGSDVARALLDRNGLQQVRIEEVAGGDHYDPSQRVVRLSSNVYRNASLTSLGVAAHEVGHAVQHSQAYAPLALRSSFVPVANFGSQASWPIFFIGLVFDMPLLLNLGIILFSLAVVIQLINLPVEYNASSRAMHMLSSSGFISGNEERAVRGVLDAAALTYVAAAVSAILTLLRYMALSSRRRR